MASIEKRGRRYRVRWRDGGVWQSQRCPDLATARRVRREVERAQALGERWRPRDDGAIPSLADMMAAYLEDERRRLAPTTLRSKHEACELFLRHLRTGRPRGRLTPDLLTRDALAAWWSAMTAAGLAVGTANLRIVHLRTFWAWAWDSETLGELVPRPRRVALPATPASSVVRAPTWADADAAIEHAGPEWTRRLLWLQRCTGLRVSQALRLEWADVDLDARRLTVRPELGKSRQERRGRVVPLAPVLADELAGWGVREGRIVQGAPRANPHIRVRAAWRRSGVDPAVWAKRPTHSLRRCFVTQLTGAGVRQLVIRALVGHAGGVTEAAYLDPAALWDEMVAAVATVPPVGGGNVAALRREAKT